MEEQGITIGEGDVVLFHTGWTDAMLAADPATWGANLPGIDNDSARFWRSLSQSQSGLIPGAWEPCPPNPAIRSLTIMRFC